MDINRFKLSFVSLFLITICFSILPLTVHTASRGISVISDLSHQSGKLGSYRALIVGINDYKDRKIPDLETAVNDATAMANLLRKRYGFKVKLLLDRKATRKAIYRALQSLASSTKPDDSVLIYYAGHGDLDRVSEDRWWIPSDARGGEPETYLDNFQVQKYIRGMRARHVLLVSDSCYSGSLFGQARAMLQVIDDKYYLNLYNEKSRWGMTSGNKTPVSDQGYETKKMWVSLAAGQDKTLDVHLTPVAAYQSGTSQSKKVTNSLGMAFVYIEPGTFIMGSPSDESGRDGDETQHRVTLTKGFYMQTTEVTQGQWKAVMGNNPSRFKNCGGDCPVEKVSWNDVQQFIRKLNQREGGNRYRLPTEAEWEYSARAGSTTGFASGGISELKCGFDSNLDAMGWYCGNSSVSYSGCFDTSKWSGPKCAGTHSVAQKQPNAWGLYDMHGNVWEWCQDWYGKYSSGSVTDPTGPSGGSGRVDRGGSWSCNAECCRSANRVRGKPGFRYGSLGFRLLRTH